MIIPFLFEYHSFIIDLTGIDIKFSKNWEFEDVKWFNEKSLPKKTHLGVKYSLYRFKKSRAFINAFKYFVSYNCVTND